MPTALLRALNPRRCRLDPLDAELLSRHSVLALGVLLLLRDSLHSSFDRLGSFLESFLALAPVLSSKQSDIDVIVVDGHVRSRLACRNWARPAAGGASPVAWL